MALPTELLSLMAALMYASSQVVTKLATQHGSVMSGFVVSLGAGTFALGALAMVSVESWRMPLPAVALFVLAGVAGAGMGRLFMMRAVRDAGASVASPVLSSTQPVAGTVLAVIVLRENVSGGRLLALTLVVAGLWVCARGGSANHASAPVGIGTGARAKLLVWPMLAGAALATSDLLRKTALELHPDAILGALIGVAAATGGWLLAVAVRAPGELRIRPPSFGWFALHGVLTAVAATFLFLALRVGDLSVVAPIVAVQPVFVVALGALLLRDLEAVRVGTVVGAIVVFSGVAAMSLVDGAG